MGGSSSKSSQTINNNTVNQNYMNSLNKTIMNSGVETMINNASSCSSSVNVNNSCDMSGAKIGGDFNFSGNQTAKANVNFNCIQANQTSADMATSMASAMAAEMKALNGTEAAANLNTASQASNTTGFLSTPGGASKSKSKTDVNNNVTNETISNVENVFEQNLNNSFSANTVNECIGKTSVSNSQDLSNIDVGGNANVQCVQTASVEQVQECKQLSEAISATTQKTFQELGLTVATESTTGSTTESTVTSSAENVATSAIQELGTALAGIMDAFGLAFLGPILGPSIILCCCLVFIGLIFFVISQVSGGGSGSGGGGSGSGNISGAQSFMNPSNISGLSSGLSSGISSGISSGLSSGLTSGLTGLAENMVGGVYEFSDIFSSSII